MQLMPEATVTYQVIYSNEYIEVRRNNISGHHGLFSRKEFTNDQLISAFTAEQVFRKPSYQTIQISDRRHISLQPHFLQYVNHSCEPNCFFNTTDMEFIALHAVNSGDELTFFYPSTEWRMAQPFMCYCGKINCCGLIEGASQMPGNLLKQYKLTTYIHKKLNTFGRYD